MHVRHPVGLRSFVDRPGAATFATLFAVESFARGLLATVIALQALALFGQPARVSLVYSLVGVAALAGSFAIPSIIRRLTRRWTYTLGALLLVAAGFAFATVTPAGQVAGMMLRVFGAACLSICTSLYIIQYIERREFTRAEPLRIQAAALAWMVGPTLGVVLYRDLGPAYAYGASAAGALVLLALFWYLRLKDDSPIQPATAPPPRPLRAVGKFFAAARLRRAWIIVFGRSSWWVFLFLYAPLFAMHSGLGEVAGALVVSAANGLLFASPIVGRLASRFGIRRVVVVSFAGAGIATIVAGSLIAWPLLAIAALLVGAVGCVALDAVGNIPFLRMVRRRERAEMTTVFRTYLDVSELVPPAVFAVLVGLFGFAAVFWCMGAGMLVCAAVASGLPQRLGAEDRPRRPRALRSGDLAPQARNVAG